MPSEGDILCDHQGRAIGMIRARPGVACTGHCESTGYVHVHREETDPVYKELFDEAERVKPNEPGDDWHTVKCPICNGVGRRQ